MKRHPKCGHWLVWLMAVSLGLAYGAEGNVPMTRPEEVIATHYTKYYHSSTFVELSDGRILHFGGSDFTVSTDGGLTWSKPFQRRDQRGDPVGGGTGPSLVRLSGKAVGLAVSRVSPADRGRIVFWRSEDGGETWAAPVNVTEPSPFVYQSCYQDVFLRTSSGRIVLPIYMVMRQMRDNRQVGWGNRTPPFTGVLVAGQWAPTDAHYFDSAFGTVMTAYSDDDGRSWKLNKDGGLYILLDWSGVISSVYEPSVAEVAPGRLLMMLRTGMGRLFQTWSDDNGETWTRPEATSLAASTAPAQVRRLPMGHLLVVWNQESEEEIRRGLSRTRLSAAISRNGGSVWEFFQNVESQHETVRVPAPAIRPLRPAQIYSAPGQPTPELAEDAAFDHNSLGRWSYPSVLVLKDRVLIAHTFNTWEADPAKAVLERKGPQGSNQKLKVLPLKWFYGGRQPAENPALQRFQQYQPAKP
jgi:predicted neuraminidase